MKANAADTVTEQTLSSGASSRGSGPGRPASRADQGRFLSQSDEDFSRDQTAQAGSGAGRDPRYDSNSSEASCTGMSRETSDIGTVSRETSGFSNVFGNVSSRFWGKRSRHPGVGLEFAGGDGGTELRQLRVQLVAMSSEFLRNRLSDVSDGGLGLEVRERD